MTEWYNSAWRYRRQITIDHHAVAGSDQTDFPFLFTLSDPLFKSAAQGGHIAQPQAEGLLFIWPATQTPLHHELEAYHPDTGEVRVWVKIPTLGGQADTLLYLYYGNSTGPFTYTPECVWEGGYQAVLHLGPVGGSVQNFRQISHSVGAGLAPALPQGQPRGLPLPKFLDAPSALTVEAWVYAPETRAEALQALVSKWALRPALDAFEAFDASHTDDLDTKGYFGAVFDGRYVYFAPAYDGTGNHGKVLRYDTHHSFTDGAGWSAYDAGQTSGLSSKGYYGGIFDGRYIYFVPRLDKNFTPEVTHHSRVLRYDTTLDFKDSRSWQAYDAGNPVSYQGAAFDGRYIYFCPGYEHVPSDNPTAIGYQWQGVIPSGKILRYDTHGSFTDSGSYTTYDASGTHGLDTRCYDGAVFDGRYIYFVPLESRGVVLRHDTRSDFTSGESWSAYDARYTSGYEMGWSVGAIFDGRYIYFVPYSNGVVLRYDTTDDFHNPDQWLAYDAGHTSGLDTWGYDGAIFDGKYIYFIPFHQGQDASTGFHATVLRYDTAAEFTDPSAWSACDAAETAGLNPVGFNGGAFDGRYAYFAPWRDGVKADGLPAAHGRVLRYDTTGAGASFSLRYNDYGHNGGLCGALPGPAFLINTEAGVRQVRANQPLAAGWRHLAGVYDGASLSLVIDGVLVGRSPADGPIQNNATPVVVDRIQDGLGHFAGHITEIRISHITRSIEWLCTVSINLRNPTAWVHLGVEESLIER